MQLYVYFCLLCGNVCFLTMGLAQENSSGTILVNRTVGDSVALSVKIPKSASDTEILWFCNNSLIAEVENGRKKTNYIKTFDGRLDVYNNGSLIIRHLQKNDSGTYKGTAIFGNLPQVNQEFILYVSDKSCSFQRSCVLSISALHVLLVLHGIDG